MTDLEIKILDLIIQNKSSNYIQENLKISRKQLWLHLSFLKRKGFDFYVKYYYDGEMVYQLVKELSKESKSFDIITSKNDQSFVCLAYSDLHIGSPDENLELVNRCYEYCAKNGINIIFNGGDFIDSFFNPNCRPDNLLLEQTKQIEYAIKNHPYDQNILNFMILGNHDYRPYRDLGQNFMNVLSEQRHDIVPIGYGIGQVNVKNDIIHLRHHLGDGITQNFALNRGIMLVGHSHRFKIQEANIGGGHYIYLPALKNEGNQMRSTLKITLTFSGGYFNTCTVEQLLVDYNFQKISEYSFPIALGNKNNKINLEEERIKDEVIETTDLTSKENAENEKIQENTNLSLKKKHLSQSEKFNLRYGIK